MQDRSRIFNARSPHQHSVRIDAVGCAGKQGTQIFPRNDLYIVDLIRPNHLDLVYLVGDRSVQHRNCECVAELHLVQVCKEFRMGQAAMRGKNTMGAFSAHRE